MIFRMRAPFHADTAPNHSPPGWDRSSSSSATVAKTAAAQIAGIVGGSTFSTRAANCNANGDGSFAASLVTPGSDIRSSLAGSRAITATIDSASARRAYGRSIASSNDSTPDPAGPADGGAGPHIGTLNEGSLHAALKAHYAEPGDEFEVPLGRFVIDVARRWGEADELLIEIQTSSFASMGSKLDHILGEHRVLLVHPIAVRTRLERTAPRSHAGPVPKPRRSPKRGSIYSLFEELVSIPTLLDHPNLELDVALVEVTKRQIPDPKARRGRGGWRTIDRRLETINSIEHFATVADLVRLLPEGLPPTFTTADLAASGKMSRDEAQRLAYCFRAANLFDQVGRSRRGIEYRRSD